VTVELSFDGSYDLEPDAAEILIQLSTSSVMWQKERLLDIALANLPQRCRSFAWLDCDVIFHEDGWIDRTREALVTYPLVQPFSHVIEPPPDEIASPHARTRDGVSLAYTLQDKDAVSQDLLCGNMRVDYNCNSGLAWAARREVFDDVGFYDACVMGSGNRAMLCAALGEPAYGSRALRMTPAWADHYEPWAKRHFERVDGRIGAVPGTITHLWHGDLRHRRYQSRHDDFSTFRFDPEKDVEIDVGGSWRWSSPKPDMHRFVAQYFKDRQEDVIPDDPDV